MGRRKLRIPTKVTHSGPAADARLAEIGLSAEIITKSVIYGQMQRDGCSALDPPTYPGTTGWAATVRQFRDCVIPLLGWKISNTANFCTTISPDGEWAVAISTGNKATGVESGDSNFKNRGGPLRQRAIERNQRSLFEELEREIPSLILSKTWVLFIARKGDYVACELKLPLVLDGDGRVEAWAERIMIPTIKLGDVPAETTRRQGSPKLEDGAKEIDIDVTRRTES